MSRVELGKAVCLRVCVSACVCAYCVCIPVFVSACVWGVCMGLQAYVCVEG